MNYMDYIAMKNASHLFPQKILTKLFKFIGSDCICYLLIYV